MTRSLASFLVVLLGSLALLAVVADALVLATTRRWFERDLTSQAQLAVQGAERSLLSSWRNGQRRDMELQLDDIARNSRVFGAVVCDSEGTVQARSASLSTSSKENVDCSGFSAFSEVPATRASEDGARQLTSVPCGREQGLAGVVIVHDTALLTRREGQTRRFLLMSFGLLAVAAGAFTLIASRLSWRGWNQEIRRLLTGDGGKRRFHPALRDVRELIERISVERESDGGSTAWTPERLRALLKQHLQGERVVVLANREPYIHEKRGDDVTVLHPASGLVTALEPVVRACAGVWIAHGSGSADREHADKDGRLAVPPGDDLYTLRRLWLSKEEEAGYYYGFANEGLWPLCHMAHTRPVFRQQDWEQFVVVNRRFADAACAEVESNDPIILVQDYHLALAPQMIRDRLPKATILTFWHCPWPHAERFSICPFAEEVLRGLLGSSIVGFHTQAHCNNFLESVDRKLEARVDREEIGVVHGGRATLVRPYPISIEWPNRWAEGAAPVDDCRRSVFAELGLPRDALLGVGIDRLDYIKGIEERFGAVERLLEREPALRGRFVFAQLAAPSRGQIEAYKALDKRVEGEAARINQRFGDGSYRPIVLLRAHHEPPDVFRYMRAADVCYVSSLHDGMNLVAKEFIAARSDERGVLVVSEFAGAARELSEALIVNPYDLDGAARALNAALRMTVQEQRDRMRAMRGLVAEFNVYRWAGKMLVDAARVRRRERVSGRIAALTSERAA